MPYENLNRLIQGSSSARRYFLSLPVELQLALHEHNDYVHSAAELHNRVYAVEAYRKQLALSGFDARNE